MGRPAKIEVAPFLQFGLARQAAAAYVDKTLAHFDRMVASGEMPPPRIFGGEETWIRTELEAALLSSPQKGAKKIAPGTSIYELVGR